MMSEKEKLDLVREIIRHEDNLVNNRVTWLLVLQGFLFTAFVNGLSLLDKLVDQRFRPRLISGLVVIGALGITNSITARNTISSAYKHSYRVGRWWEEHIRDSTEKHPPIKAPFPSDQRFYRWFSTAKLPYSLITAWVALIALVLLPL
jgi:hypothetical protein